MYHPYAPPGAYAPPAPSNGALPGAAIALYNANQVALATFLGTTLGGSILLALNERRLGRPQAAFLTIVIGVLATAAFCGIGFALPNNFPGAPLGLLSVIGLRVIANKRQSTLVDAHLQQGGKRGSNWAAVGIALGSLLVVFVPIVVIAMVVALASNQ
jgi:hypothetical protein